MMVWLSEWLKQILAVLLLAAVVDLLVPGKAYERYTRLALGLIILTAMLGPVLKLLSEDPERLIGRGFAGLGESSGAPLPRMPGLDDIRREAGELRERQERQASELAARALETSIRETVNRLDGPKAREVRVGIGNGRDGAEIASVMIVLEDAREAEPNVAPETGTEPADEAGGEGDRAGAAIRIGPIGRPRPVEAVRVNIGAVPAFGPDGAEDGRAPDGLKAAPDGIAAAVKSAVHHGWGVEPERITVWVPA